MCASDVMTYQRKLPFVKSTKVGGGYYFLEYVAHYISDKVANHVHSDLYFEQALPSDRADRFSVLFFCDSFHFN